MRTSVPKAPELLRITVESTKAVGAVAEGGIGRDTKELQFPKSLRVSRLCISLPRAYRYAIINPFAGMAG